MSKHSADPLRRVPLVPLRDAVVYPGMTTSLLIGRPLSLRSVETAREEGGTLLLVAQRDRNVFTPRMTTSTPADIGEASGRRAPDGTTVVAEGEARAKVSPSMTRRAVTAWT